ncbi:hypothetical protein J2752_000265 [Halarchaeum rubridurum]|uniref:Uncharacterized protein n=1 Tax=Halarchaeum rubridurum TaxID=489911 RepID=A0A830FMV9_9EURY|nr:DUF5793 family protein [Halarchaeum rubridurum]MBP1953384.1 hypothetical protein [Halarchaeum rubridurum]GGM65704.1 hypothetical protein GCM10009017_14740 [Halarchaeum rubridurum]
MRREDFTLDVSDVEWVETGGDPRRPTVTIDFDGSRTDLDERLTGTEEQALSADETDVTLRLQGDPDDPATTGVVAVTDRVTGGLLLELDEDADDVLRFVRAARTYGERSEADADAGGYRVVIAVDGEPVRTYEKETFLVYSEDGDLLRSRSLIPGGVEL